MPIYKIAGQKKDGLQKYRVVVNYTDENGKKRTVERREYGKAQAERAEAVLLRYYIADEWKKYLAAPAPDAGGTGGGIGKAQREAEKGAAVERRYFHLRRSRPDS